MEFLVVGLSARVVVHRPSGSVKSVFLFTVEECREKEREGIPLLKPTKKTLVQPTECLNAQTVNVHRFSQLPTTRKQTPHLLLLLLCVCVCVHPLPSENETRDND